MGARIEAVIFDWAGTTVDFGSLAPIRALAEVFRREGVDVRDEDARRDMGIFKKDHIRKLIQIPDIARCWKNAKGTDPTEEDVDRLFHEFIPLQVETLVAQSKVIEGVPQVCKRLRSLGLKIGSTTGYTRPMLDLLTASAAEQGYQPDMALCPDDVGGGRPLPWMCWRIAMEFKLASAAAAVKIGDTPSDIEEGRNAGMWTVGVAATGNEIGLSAADFDRLPPAERAQRIDHARKHLLSAGAHYVVDRVSEIDSIIEEIEMRGVERLPV